MLTEVMLFFLSPLSIGDIQTNANELLENGSVIVSNYKKPKTLFDINQVLTYNVYDDTSYQRYLGNGVCLNNVKYYPTDMNKIVSSEKLKISQLCWDCLLRDEALNNLKRLSEDFYTKFKKPLTVNSAFRSYDNQVKIKQKTAKDKASNPGSSEHQLGLAVDIAVSLLNTTEKEWFKENIYLYGFTLSYQKGLEVDGYAIEDWHIRYLGENLAKELYQNKITFAEWMNYIYEKDSKNSCKEDNFQYNKEYFKRKKMEQFKKILLKK